MSLADIQNKMKSRYNPEQAPAELRMMYGAAADAATQGGDFGPEIWGRIWPHRSCSKPDAKGERLKTFEWRIDEGKRGDCCIAEVPHPIATHTLYIGWKETKKGSFFAKEKVRCMSRMYQPDARGVSHIVATGVSCPFCQLLGATRWRAIQIGGVIDMRTDIEPLIGSDGRAIGTPPRMLILDSDAAQQAIVDGLMERHIRGKPMIGTVFHVSRGSGKNTSRVGTNWIPDLDITVPQREIDKLYEPVNLDMAYPILDGKHDTPFEPKEIKDIINAMLERHIFLCIKYGDKMQGKFLGYDEHAAESLGFDLKKIKEQAGTHAGETDAEPDAPASRGLRLMAEQDPNTQGPSLTDLKDKDVPAAEEAEVTREDILEMKKEDLVDLAADWEITLPKRANDTTRRLAILTSPKGFGMSQPDAEGLLGLMPPESPQKEAAGPQEAVEAVEEAEEAEEAEEVDVEALKAELLDAGTPIGKVVATAREYDVEPVLNSKGQVLRSKTVEAIVEVLSTDQATPWA